MIWSAPILKAKQQRIVTRFAWLPVRVGEHKIWLQRYFVLQETVENLYTHEFSWGDLVWNRTNKKATCATREQADAALVFKTPAQRRENLTVIKGDKE